MILFANFICRYPNLKSVRELVYKRGYGKVNKQRIAITDNSIIEQQLGKHGIICVEDLIHEIYSVGEHFKEANNFLWPFKLSSPKGGFRKMTTHFVEGGDHGNREDKINQLIRKMNWNCVLNSSSINRLHFSLMYLCSCPCLCSHCCIAFTFLFCNIRAYQSHLPVWIFYFLSILETKNSNEQISRLYTRVCYNFLVVHNLRGSKGLFTQQHVHGGGGPQVGEVTRLGGVKKITIVYMQSYNPAVLGPVVRTPVSANPGLNFNPGFFFFSSKAHYRIIFFILFRVSSHQIVGKEN